MTHNDYKAAMTEFERIISTHPDYAGVTIHDDHPVALISRSIRIAHKLMQEPSEGMIKAGIQACMQAMYGGVIKHLSEGMVSSITFSCVHEFEAMRDKMLDEVENENT